MTSGEERFDDVLMFSSKGKNNRMRSKHMSKKGNELMKAQRVSYLKSVRKKLRRKSSPAIVVDNIENNSCYSDADVTVITNETIEDKGTLVAPPVKDTEEKVKDKEQDRNLSSAKDGTSECEKMEDTDIVKHISYQGIPQSVPILLADQKHGGLSESFAIWTNDLRALISSPHFHRVIHSTGKLVSVGGSAVMHAAMLPITIPMRVTSSVVSNAIHAANITMISVINPVGTVLFSNQRTTRQIKNCSENNLKEVGKEHDKHSQLHEQVIGFAFDIVPIAVDTVCRVKDEIGSTVFKMFGLGPACVQNSEREQKIRVEGTAPCVDKEEKEIESSRADASNKTRLSSTISNCSSQTDLGSRTAASNTDARSSFSEDMSMVENSNFLRICDLGMQHALSSNQCLPSLHLELKPFPDDESLFRINEALNNMVKMALHFSGHDPLIAKINTSGQFTKRKPHWKEEGATSRHHKRYNKLLQAGSQNEAIALMEKELLIWSGIMKNSTHTDDSPDYGNDVPMFKARGIIPCLAPIDLVEILLDSSKVSMYNKFSNGRNDIYHLHEENLQEMGLDVDNNDEIKTIEVSKGVSKIVETETKVPFSNKTIKMRTLLHARKLRDGAYILVSRSVETADSSAKLGVKNEIIWGVNILRRVAGFDNKVDLTNFAQANSTVVPNFLAHKVGMIAISDFFKHLRKIENNEAVSDKLR